MSSISLRLLMFLLNLLFTTLSHFPSGHVPLLNFIAAANGVLFPLPMSQYTVHVSLSGHVPLLNFIAASNAVPFAFRMSWYVVGVSLGLTYNNMVCPSIASSAVVFGLFGLYDSRRLTKDDNGKSTATCYVVYNTSLTSADDPDNTGVDANLRVFCRQGTALFVDGTVVYAYARMFAPPKGPVILDTIAVHPFPGDASSDEYHDHIPQNVPSVVVVYGSVTGPPSIGPDGSCAFPLTISEYVRDAVR